MQTRKFLLSNRAHECGVNRCETKREQNEETKLMKQEEVLSSKRKKLTTITCHNSWRRELKSLTFASLSLTFNSSLISSSSLSAATAAVIFASSQFYSKTQHKR